MTEEPANLPAVTPGDDAELGPRMQALTQLQRKLVNAYLEHPTWSATAMAIEAGYSQSSASVRGSVNLRDERVIAAINEEGSRRLRAGGPLAVMGLISMVLNPQHKDHFRACVVVADRSGYHALSEHKVTVDDKRPQTKAELMAAVKGFAAEMKLSPQVLAELTGEKIIEGEFTEMQSSEVYIPSEDEVDVSEIRERLEANGEDQDAIDAQIAAEMEDL